MPASRRHFSKAREDRSSSSNFEKRKHKYSPFRAEKTDMHPSPMVLNKARVEILISRSEKKEHLRSEPRIWENQSPEKETEENDFLDSQFWQSQREKAEKHVSFLLRILSRETTHNWLFWAETRPCKMPWFVLNKAWVERARKKRQKNMKLTKLHFEQRNLTYMPILSSEVAIPDQPATLSKSRVKGARGRKT